MQRKALVKFDHAQQLMREAREIAQRQSDHPVKSKRVGCAILPKNGEPVFGVNKVPPRIDPFRLGDDVYCEKPWRNYYIEHAERDAIAAAHKMNVNLLDASFFITWFPCVACVRMMINVGMFELVYGADTLSDPKWGAEFKIAAMMLHNAEVYVRHVDQKDIESNKNLGS